MAVDENERRGMALSAYGRVLWRGKWIIIVATAVLCGLGFAYSSMKTPLYQASSQLIYENQINVSDPLSTGGSSDPAQRQADIDSVATVIGSPQLVKSAEALLSPSGDRLPDYSVLAATDVTQSQSGISNTVSITAVSPDAEAAAAVANAYAEAFTAYRKASVQAAVKQAESVVQSRLDTYLSDASKQSGDYAILQQRLQDLQILEATTTGNFRVLVRAGAPAAPFSPKPMRSGLMGAVGGFVIGAGIVLLLAQFDTRVRTQEEAAAIFAVPVLGHIRKATPKSIEEQPLFVLSDAHSPAAEAVRKLQWSLEYAEDLESDLKSILLTSCLQGEGKSLTLCNLALAMAATGKRVVLVDADLRRPRMHRYLNLPNAVGVSTVLAGRTEVAKALHTRLVGTSVITKGPDGEVDGAQDGANRLHVLTSGPLPPNAAHTIASKRFALLIDELKAQFDMVLVDAPALLAVGDSAAIARVVDGLVFLVDLTRARRPLLVEAASQIALMPCRNLGLIVMTQRAAGRGYENSYSYYSHDDSAADAQPRRVVRA